MNRPVIDASVAIKWTVPEIHSAEALRYLDPSMERHAPELLLAEFASIVWKKTNRGEIPPEKAAPIVAEFLQADLILHPMSGLVEAALTIALATGRSAYDCMYLALAESLDTKVVTADRKLFNALRGGPHARLVHWVEDGA